MEFSTDQIAEGASYVDALGCYIFTVNHIIPNALSGGRGLVNYSIYDLGCNPPSMGSSSLEGFVKNISMLAESPTKKYSKIVEQLITHRAAQCGCDYEPGQDPNCALALTNAQTKDLVTAMKAVKRNR